MKTTGNRWLDIIRLRTRSLAGRWRPYPEFDQELDQELQFHIETLADEYQAAGMNREAALRRARLDLGAGIENIREECRDARGWSFLENAVRDAFYCLRGLRKDLLFTTTAVGALALGIGVNSAVFTLFYSLVLRPLPVSDPGSVRNIHVRAFGPGPRAHYGTQYYVSWDEFRAISAGAKSAEITGVAEASLSRKDDPRPVHAQLVSANFLNVMGAKPALGRLFTPDEATSPGGAQSVVLSSKAWHNWFNADPGVIGKQVVLNRTPFAIVGVAAADVTGPLILIPDLWMPLTMQGITRPGEVLIDKPTQAWIQLIARLRPGFTDAQLSAEMKVLAQTAVQAHSPKKNAVVDIATGAFFNYPFLRKDGAPLIGIVSLAVFLVLIVACANVANMLLARGLSRRREIAIRLSMGAGRGRLLQQLLTESLMLAMLGGAAGLLLASAAARGVIAMIPANMMGGAHQLDLRPDIDIVLFTLGVSLLTGLIFGLIPAWNSLRFDLSPAIRSEGLGEAVHRGRGRLQFSLITAQVAVSLVLLVNASLLLRGLRTALTVDAGQATSRILIAGFDLRQQQYTPEQASAYIQRLREAAAALPGVKSTATTFVEPLHQQCGTSVRVVGHDNRAGDNILVNCDEVSPDYFRTMNVRLLQGRDFTRLDAQTNAKVAIVDEEFARTRLGGSALGRVIREGDGADLQIIGVAATTRTFNLSSLEETGKLYRPMHGLRHVEAKMVLAYDGPYGGVEREFRNASASLDPNVNVRTHPIEESLNSALLPARMASAAAAALGGFALLLAGSGVYGVVAFAVSRRRREMGIRIALGADRVRVLGLMLWQGMRPVLAGAVIGLALAAAGAQLIRTMLYGVSPFDPLGFSATAGLLAFVAFLAAAIPARAALSVDPAVTLRHE